MFRMAWQNIRRRKGRTALVVLGIMQAIALYLILSALMLFFQGDIEQQLAGLTNVVIVQAPSEDKLRFPPTSSDLRAEAADGLMAMSSVSETESSPVLIHTITPSPAPGMPPSLAAMGIQPGKEKAYLGAVTEKVAGRVQLQGPNEAVIGFGAAEALGGGAETPKRVGDTITVKGHQFQVVGVLPKTNMLVDGTVLVPLPTLQEVLDQPGRITAILLTARDGLDRVVTDVRARAPSLQPVTPADLAKDYGDLLSATSLFFQSVRGTVLLVAVLIVMTVMMMAINERRRDIGTLRALGASPFVVIRLVVYEAVLLSLTAGIAGTAIAATLSMLFFDRARVDLMLALQSVLASVLVGALASLLPAYVASRVNPVESLRYE